MQVADLSLDQMDEETIQNLSLDERNTLLMNMWKKKAEVQQINLAPGEALQEKKESDERKELHKRWQKTMVQKKEEEQRAKERAAAMLPTTQLPRKRKSDDEEINGKRKAFADLTNRGPTMTPAMSKQQQQQQQHQQWLMMQQHQMRQYQQMMMQRQQQQQQQQPQQGHFQPQTPQHLMNGGQSTSSMPPQAAEAYPQAAYTPEAAYSACSPATSSPSVLPSPASSLEVPKNTETKPGLSDMVDLGPDVFANVFEEPQSASSDSGGFNIKPIIRQQQKFEAPGSIVTPEGFQMQQSRPQTVGPLSVQSSHSQYSPMSHGYWTPPATPAYSAGQATNVPQHQNFIGNPVYQNTPQPNNGPGGAGGQHMPAMSPIASNSQSYSGFTQPQCMPMQGRQQMMPQNMMTQQQYFAAMQQKQQQAAVMHQMNPQMYQQMMNQYQMQQPRQQQQMMTPQQAAQPQHRMNYMHPSGMMNNSMMPQRMPQNHPGMQPSVSFSSNPSLFHSMPHNSN